MRVAVPLPPDLIKFNIKKKVTIGAYEPSMQAINGPTLNFGIILCGVADALWSSQPTQRTPPTMARCNATA